MAMHAREELESVDEPVLRRFLPKPVAWDTVNPDKIVISYDRPSDTLLIHLFGRGHSGVSVSIDRYLYVMVDPDSEQIIGIHSEGFLAQAVKEHPWQIDVLQHAELRGITPGEVWALQRDILGVRRQRAAVARNAPKGNWQALAAFLGPEAARWGLPDAPAA